jgi:hypothetical protein
MLEKKKINTYSNILREKSFLIEYLSLFLILLLVPLLIGKPQYLVGTIVNTVLVYSTLKFGFKKTIPFLILPSCMSYLRGLLFGSLTIFLVYLIPFIIISNAIYSFTISKFKNKVFGILIACILKTGFLYLIVNILINTISLPDIFLTTMGINQLITGITGGFLGYLTYRKFKV